MGKGSGVGKRMNLLASYTLYPDGWHVVVSKRVNGTQCIVLDAKFKTEQEAKAELLRFLAACPDLAPIQTRNA